MYNTSVVGVPMSGSLMVMHYRTDVLAAAGLPAPSTWHDLLHVAKALNGSDFDGGACVHAVGWVLRLGARHEVLLGRERACHDVLRRWRAGLGCVLRRVQLVKDDVVSISAHHLAGPRLHDAGPGECAIPS